jgi:hypothetical protein
LKIVHAMKSAMSRLPGTMPARKSRPIDVSVAMP